MKTVYKLLSIVLIVGLVPFAFAFAQDDDAEMSDEDMVLYEDASGLFTVEYPAAFFAYPNFFGMDETFPPFLNVVFDDSEVDLDELEELPAADGVSIGVIFWPRPFFPEMGGFPEDITVEAFSEAMVVDRVSRMIEDESERETLLEAITIETITLADGSEAALVTYPEETEDNIIAFFDASEDVIAFVSLQTEPGARTEELEALHMAVVNSLEFTGTAADVVMMDMDMMEAATEEASD
jgi:hypothetical protein